VAAIAARSGSRTTGAAVPALLTPLVSLALPNRPLVRRSSGVSLTTPGRGSSRHGRSSSGVPRRPVFSVPDLALRPHKP
jgi:hypothetical protein